MLIIWHVICVKVKYVVSYFGRLVSLTWYIYEWYVNIICVDWVGLVHPCKVWMNDIWPWMMLRGSFMWKLEHSHKFINVEVESRNGILQRKGMMELLLIGWNDIILIVRKVIMRFLPPLEGIPKRSSLVG